MHTSDIVLGLLLILLLLLNRLQVIRWPKLNFLATFALGLVLFASLKLLVNLTFGA